MLRTVLLFNTEKYNKYDFSQILDLIIPSTTDIITNKVVTHLKNITVKLKNKAETLGGYAKIFYNIHKLKEENSDIEYLTNWTWIMREIINKQEMIKEPTDIRKYFVSSKNRKGK